MKDTEPSKSRTTLYEKEWRIKRYLQFYRHLLRAFGWRYCIFAQLRKFATSLNAEDEIRLVKRDRDRKKRRAPFYLSCSNNG
jgi:hypothetical protein